MKGAVVALASFIVPSPRRREWRREWRSELSSVSSARAWRHTWACFADARELRRLERGTSSRPDGTRMAPGGRMGAGFDPVRNVRTAVRSLSRNPVFSLAAVVALALGIGANTAIFSLVNAIVFKPPAVHAPHELVRVYTSTPEGEPYGATSHLELQDIIAQTDAFEDVIGYTLAVGALQQDDGLTGLLGEVVTGNYFSGLGVPMALGRGIGPSDDLTPGSHPVVVLGHGFWTRQFAADPSIVGETVRLNATTFEVIGVVAPEYQGTLPGLVTEFYAPAMMMGSIAAEATGALTDRRSRQFLVQARLRDGATVEEAEAELTLVAQRLAEAYPETNDGHTITAVPAGSVRFHPRADRILMPVAALMLSVPALVLLITCTNLAALLLARATERRKEIAVRLALGARRRHIIGQLLVESVMLALVGSIFGVLLAVFFVELAARFKPPILISLSLDFGLDYRVLAFTLLTAVGSGLLFGLAPALQSSKPELSRALKDEDALGFRARRFSLRNTLIVGQVAVSMLLLLVAGLFVRSLQQAQTIDPGFDTGGSVVLTMSAAIGYDEDTGPAYYRELLDHMASAPGVTGAVLADRLPLGLSSQTMSVLPDPDVVGAAAGTNVDTGIYEVDFARVSPGYFRTLQVDLLAGRDFDARDTPDAPRVAIVSEAAAELFWPGESALGRRLPRPEGDALEVVGVARDTRVRSLGEEARPYLYVPFEQSYESLMELIVATDSDPAEFLPVAQDYVLQVDPDVMPLESMTMADGNNVILFPVRAAAGLMGAFGSLGLLLSAVGIIGSLSYSVSRRSREVGVRLALGASPGKLVGMVVAGGMRLVAVGMVLGTLAALGVGSLLGSFLVGISPADPVTFAGIALLLAAVAAVASYIPARRVAAADPLVVLRHD